MGEGGGRFRRVGRGVWGMGMGMGIGGGLRRTGRRGSDAMGLMELDFIDLMMHGWAWDWDWGWLMG